MGLVAAVLWQLRDRLAARRPLRALPRPRRPRALLVEFIRRNEDVLLGLTQPQLISIVMVVAGAAWLALLYTRPESAESTRRPPARQRA